MNFSIRGRYIRLVLVVCLRYYYCDYDVKVGWVGVGF